MLYQIRYPRFMFIKVFVKDTKTMKTNKSCLLHFYTATFLFLFPCMLLSEDILKQNIKQNYIIIGKIEACKYIKWSGNERVKSQPIETRTLPDGKKVFTVKMSVFRQMALVLGNCDIFVITDNEATKVDIEKQIVLMQDTRTGFMTEKKYSEVSKRLLALDKRLLYYASPYDVPEELTKKYELEGSLIFQEQEKTLPLREGTREFGLELRKLGITLSRSETNAVSQNPPDAQDDLPASAEDSKSRLNEAAQE